MMFGEKLLHDMTGRASSVCGGIANSICTAKANLQTDKVVLLIKTIHRNNLLAVVKHAINGYFHAKSSNVFFA